VLGNQNLYSGMRVGITINTNPKETKMRLGTFYTRLGEELKDCIKRGIKIICIPLSLHFGKKREGHANMLIYRPFKRIVEHFEPHGQSFAPNDIRYIKDNESIQKQLIQLFEKDLTPFIGEVRYRRPDELCPDTRGFQSLEGELEGLKSEGGGYCSMWSLFLTEMILINPDKSTKNIISEVLDVTKREPAYLKNIIRGYVIEIEKELDTLLKMLGEKGFTFKVKNNKIADEPFKLGGELEKWLLSSIFSINKDIEEVPDYEPLPDTTLIPEDKTEKLKEKYYNKIKSLTKEDFRAIYDLYGLQLPDRTLKELPLVYILQIRRGVLDQYGSRGLKDIDIILNEELHKKKGAYKVGLAQTDYFNKEVEPKKKEPKKKEPKETLEGNRKKLVNNWEDENLPILFFQLLPLEYVDMEKKVNELTKKGQYVVVASLSFYIKEIIDDLYEKYGFQEILNGLEKIAGAMNEDSVTTTEDYSPMIKYLSPKNKKKLNK